MTFIDLQNVPKDVPRLCDFCGGTVDSILLVFHRCIGQASTQSLRPCLNHPVQRLLIHGREKAK